MAALALLTPGTLGAAAWPTESVPEPTIEAECVTNAAGTYTGCADLIEGYGGKTYTLEFAVNDTTQGQTLKVCGTGDDRTIDIYGSSYFRWG